jgi:addiction module HigA family antidote
MRLNMQKDSPPHRLLNFAALQRKVNQRMFCWQSRLTEPQTHPPKDLPHWETDMSRPPLHPGEILADELEELGITPTELSRQIAVPPNRVRQIIQGKRAITGDTALRLGHWFQTSPQFWLNLQAAYDLRVAAELMGHELKALPTKPKAAAGAGS